ncbi:hypothetical protein BDA99DRAFT_75629 [Phascolomyces articulosus]|uniref:Uncharacterized protein n=1 Tax=Phascolomyces articulosus TaxID=60185 RepID=A0AAD5KC04_9FUNG|nr:hypothetical protein BDA99DRAFT_75629 [Phascolomyces articulosus]
MDDYSYMPNYRPEGGALEIDEDNTNESPLSSSLRYPSAQQSIGTKENRGRVGRTRSFLAKKKPHPLRIMYPPPLQQQSSSLPINPAAEDGTRYFNSGDAIIPPSDSNNDTNTKRSRVRSHSQYGSFSILPESSNRDIEYFDKDYKNIYKLKHPASPASPASPVSSSEGQEKPNAISPSNMKKEQYDQREHRHSILSSGIGEETISNHTTIIASSSSSSTKVKNQQEKENINMKKKKLSKYLPIAVTNSHHKKHH